jgi:hypothetical protein
MRPIEENHRRPVHSAMHIRDKRHDREPGYSRLKWTHIIFVRIYESSYPHTT